MRILFISNDLIAGHLAFLLKKDGHDVKLFIDQEERKKNFHNLVTKVKDWKKELRWVGKVGLIVFDDVGYGIEQEQLRALGYNVFGGSNKGDELENDRVFCQEIFRKYGMNILYTKNFISITTMINFVKKNPSSWVVKQNNDASKSLNYIGFFEDGKDVIDVLRTYRINYENKKNVFTLQKKVTGVEVAVTRCFNGSTWVGPMLINLEHKKFFPGDIGPTTSEMGTLGWYDKNENNLLFQKTLGKLTTYLKKIDYRGIIDINCILNQDGAFPLEITSRPGSPIIHLQTELNITPWSEILFAVSTGKKLKFKYKKGFGIVVVIAIPPFPYSKKIDEHSQIGTPIYYTCNMTSADENHIHYEEVSINKKKGVKYVSDDRGYVLYVTGHGKTVQEAQKNVYKIIKKIHIPKMIYRNDIGTRFIEESQQKLKKWGYL